MKKLIFVLLILVACNGSDKEKIYEFSYGIETNESIETQVTYLLKSEYVTEQIKTIDTEIESLGVTQAYWESPSQNIKDDHYAYIKIDFTDQAGWFYFIVNDEIFDYSYISNFAEQTWVFAWYIDLEGDGF